jgi:hypothetical protein
MLSAEHTDTYLENLHHRARVDQSTVFACRHNRSSINATNVQDIRSQNYSGQKIYYPRDNKLINTANLHARDQHLYIRGRDLLRCAPYTLREK